MHVIVATDFAYVNGGAANIALGSAKGLAERGHDVTIFSGVGPVAEHLREVPGLRHVCLDQMDVWRDPNRMRAAAHGLWNQEAARRMAHLLAGFEPARTIVHLHSWTKALSSSVVRAATQHGFQVVMTLHDFFTVCPNGTFFDHGKGCRCALRPMSAACVRANCDTHSYAHKLWRVARQIVQRSIGHLPQAAGDFVSVSQASDAIFRELLPPGCHLHYVRNFTEVPRPEPIDVEGHDEVVYVGRLSAEKGPQLLADCTRRLGVRAVFVGAGPLEGAVRERNPNAEITGWLAPDQVRERMNRARVLVFPSLWYETQGLVVAEAAAMGVPAIVPDGSAARDFVTDGVTGLWFKSGDGDDLCTQIDRVMSTPGLAARMGRDAYRQFWAEPPTLDRHLERLEDVYESILARRNAS
jgi:glycosyltransferase involved in cell wall biosynthesis